MKNKQILDALGEVDEKYIEESAPGKKLRQRRTLFRWVSFAACLIFVYMLGTAMVNDRQSRIELSDASHGVTVKYTNKTGGGKSASLIYLTEEELFYNFTYTTAIFKGTALSIRNIEINYNGRKDYQSIAEIKIEKVYRGNCKEGEIVSVLLPTAFIEKQWRTNTETISALREGMTGIFMPKEYDEDSFIEQNGARIVLQDIAEYGFADGVRYAFLETEEGLIFSRGAYESISHATTLEEIEEYIENMLNGRE